MITRRGVLSAGSAILICPALAQNKFQPLLNYEHLSGGRVGLHALNLKTKKSISWRADERFLMCSTFKASLVACVLARIDQKHGKLDDLIFYTQDDLLEYAPAAKENLIKGALSVEALCKATVEISDNTCANLLLGYIGGPSFLTNFWRLNGDAVSRLDHNEPQLNRLHEDGLSNTTTPAAMAETLNRFIFGTALSVSSRQHLKEWLIGCKTGEKRIRSKLPKNWIIGDKTGNNGSDAASDIAVAWKEHDDPLIITAYTQGGSPTASHINDVFNEIGVLVKDML